MWRVILSAKRKHFCEKLSKWNSSKQLYRLTNELLGNSNSSVFPCDIPEAVLPGHFSSFFDQKIDLLALNLTHILCLILTYRILFVGSKLCSFERVSQEFVRKLIWDSALNTCVLDPIPTILLRKKKIRRLSALYLQNCEWLVAVWVCSSAVQGSSRDPSSEKQKQKQKTRPWCK